MRLLLITALLLASPASAQDAPDPNSPDFDPVARMQHFFPGWQPPDVSEDDISAHPLGSEQRPVRTQGPRGQREYLSRLLCRNGKAPKFQRSGSTMKPSPYGFPMDMYEVRCGAFSKTTVYMDLYHPRIVETEAVPGFTLRE
jgi:hypothetical protein